MTKDDIDTLRREGLSDEAILDATCVAAYFNYINRMSDALGIELEEVFRGKEK
jgi:alkylhydroperoxidase family enzyme